MQWFGEYSMLATLLIIRVDYSRKADLHRTAGIIEYAF